MTLDHAPTQEELRYILMNIATNQIPTYPMIETWPEQGVTVRDATGKGIGEWKITK